MVKVELRGIHMAYSILRPLGSRFTAAPRQPKVIDDGETLIGIADYLIAV